MPILYEAALIALTLEEWGYPNKAHLRGLNLVHLYKEMVLDKINCVFVIASGTK